MNKRLIVTTYLVLLFLNISTIQCSNAENKKTKIKITKLKEMVIAKIKYDHALKEEALDKLPQLLQRPLIEDENLINRAINSLVNHLGKRNKEAHFVIINDTQVPIYIGMYKKTKCIGQNYRIYWAHLYPVDYWKHQPAIFKRPESSYRTNERLLMIKGKRPIIEDAKEYENFLKKNTLAYLPECYTSLEEYRQKHPAVGVVEMPLGSKNKEFDILHIYNQITAKGVESKEHLGQLEINKYKIL